MNSKPAPLDFKTNRRNQKVQKIIGMLISFRQKNPGSWPRPKADGKEERLLGYWCERFRNEQNKGILEETVQQQLKSIGFDLSSLPIKNWYEQLERLRQHLSGSATTNKKKDLKAYVWALRQSKAFDLLNADQKKQLDLIGLFGYVASQETGWDKRYEEVKEYVNKYNKFPTTSLKGIGVWLKRQSKLFYVGKLEPKRKELLESIGFKFTMEARKNTPWEMIFEKVVAFRQTNKKWPSYHSADGQDKKMYTWCNAQRQTYQGTAKGRSPLKPEYIIKLNSIGFHWSRKELVEAHWEDMYKKTIGYIKDGEKQGTKPLMMIPSSIDGRYNKFYHWISDQQALVSNGTLEPEKAARMKTILSMIANKIG